MARTVGQPDVQIFQILDFLLRKGGMANWTKPVRGRSVFPHQTE